MLRATLENEQEWIKVHAAEALLSVHHPEGVLAAFQREQMLHGAEPKYRIGIWPGSDRLHAAETLAKLGYRAGGREMDAFGLVARERSGSLAVDVRWVLVNSGQRMAEARLAEMLDSDDAGTRDDAAYAIRHLPSVAPATWDRLAAAAKREPLASDVRSNLMSAAFRHAPADQRATYKAEVVKYAGAGTPDQKFEACAVLGLAGETDVLPLLTQLLDNPDANVRVGAAEAVLRLTRR